MKYLNLLLLATIIVTFALVSMVPVPLNAAFGDETLGGIDITAGQAELNKGSGTPTQRITTIVGLVINSLLGLVATVFVIIIIYGGFKWMSAQGNENQIEGAKKIIISGIFGLAIVFISAAIVIFLFNALRESLGT